MNKDRQTVGKIEIEKADGIEIKESVGTEIGDTVGTQIEEHFGEMIRIEIGEAFWIETGSNLPPAGEVSMSHGATACLYFVKYFYHSYIYEKR